MLEELEKELRMRARGRFRERAVALGCLIVLAGALAFALITYFSSE